MDLIHLQFLEAVSLIVLIFKVSIPVLMGVLAVQAKIGIQQSIGNPALFLLIIVILELDIIHKVPILFFFDVIISSPDFVLINHAGGGSLEINGGSTLTVENGADFDHLSGDTIIVHTGAEIFVDGNMFNGDGGTITIDGKVTVGDTGVFTNDLSFIDGNGEIECIGNGTFDQQGTVAGTITVTGCGGAAVGSISIPLDTTSMLVAGSEMNSIWITLAIISAVGIGILIIRKNYFSAE